MRRSGGNGASFVRGLSLIHISEPTRLLSTSYAVFCLKKHKLAFGNGHVRDDRIEDCAVRWVVRVRRDKRIRYLHERAGRLGWQVEHRRKPPKLSEFEGKALKLAEELA